MAPVADRVAPRLDLEPPPALGRWCDLRHISVGARDDFPHMGHGETLAIGPAQDHAGPQRLVPLAEHSRAHFEGFARHGLGRALPVRNDGLDVTDDDPTDHAWNATQPRGPHAYRPGLPSERTRTGCRVALRESHP